MAQQNDTIAVFGQNNSVPPPPLEIYGQPLAIPQIPRGFKNALTFANIKDGDQMANFHGEHALGRYYLKSTYNALNPKKNPQSRQTIAPGNVTYYQAQLVGGKPKKSRRLNRRRKSSKKSRKHSKN